MPYLENKIVLLMERTKKREITFFEYYKQKKQLQVGYFFAFWESFLHFYTLQSTSIIICIAIMMACIHRQQAT